MLFLTLKREEYSVVNITYQVAVNKIPDPLLTSRNIFIGLFAFQFVARPKNFIFLSNFQKKQ